MCYVTHCQYPSTAVTEVLETENPLHLVQNSAHFMCSVASAHSFTFRLLISREWMCDMECCHIPWRNSLITMTVQYHMARYLVMSIVASTSTTETCVKYLCCYKWLCINTTICSRACLVMCRVMHSSSNTDSQ